MESKSYFTDEGKKLLLDAAGSKTKITYTKAKMIYDHTKIGYKPANEIKQVIRQLKSFDDIRKEVPITVVDVDKDTIKLGASFSNKNQKDYLWYNTVGWYAKRETNDELLFAVTPLISGDAGELTPTEKDDGSADISIDFYLNFSVEDTDNIVITSSDTGVVTFPEMTLALEKQENKLSKKIAENSSKITDLDKKTVKSVNGAKPNESGDATVEATILRDYDFDTKEDKVIGDEKLLPKKQNLVDKVVISQIADKFKEDEKLIKDNKSAVDNSINNLDKSVVKSVDGVKRDSNGNVAINTQAVTGYDFDNKVPTKQTKQFNQMWPVDNLVLGQIADKFKNHANIMNDLNKKAIKSVNGIKPDDSGNANLTSNIVRGYDIATKTATKKIESLGGSWLVDQQALAGFADAINKINGNTKLTNATDVNTITSTGVYILQNSANTNTPSFFKDKRGDLVVFNFDSNAKTQVWFPVGVSGRENNFAVRYWEGNNYGTWHKFVTADDVEGALVDNNKVIAKILSASDIDNLTTSIQKATGGIAKVGNTTSRDGYILTFNNPKGEGSDWKWQILLDNGGQIFYRNGLQGKWNNWKLSGDNSSLGISISSLNKNVSEITNTVIPSLEEKLTSKMKAFVTYAKNYLSNPDDKTVTNLPQGITTIYDFNPSGFDGSYSGNLITVINPLSTWSWKFQIFVGVNGALGFRSIDGGLASEWNFIKDDSGRLSSKGFADMITRINDYPSLKKRVVALENKVK